MGKPDLKQLRHGPHARTRKGYLRIRPPLPKNCPILAEDLRRGSQGHRRQARQEGLQALSHWCSPPRHPRRRQVPLPHRIQDPPSPQVHGRLIFVIRIVCAPLNLVFGAVYFNETTEQPHLPKLMIAGGMIEVPWILLVFYLYVLLPYKDMKRKEEGKGSLKEERGTLKSCTFVVLHLLFLLLSVGIAVVVGWTTYYLASVNTCRVGFNCVENGSSTTTTIATTTTTQAPSEDAGCPATFPCTTISAPVFYGGWANMGFKYLDIV